MSYNKWQSELHIFKSIFHYEITIIEESELESHRGLFYELLRQQNGTIVHVGNPDFKNQKDGGFYAGEIVDWSIDPNEEIKHRNCIYHTGLLATT